MDGATCDVIVVGAGHAGCEAALAASRMGLRTTVITMNLDTVAQMSCNPAIGGLAKGQLVREVDALGGEMGKVTDATGIQFRMLNTRKGPAVRSPRAQADRQLYKTEMKRRLEAQPNLLLRQDLVEALLVEDGRAAGVRCRSGLVYRGHAVVLTTGTFLRALTHIGTSMVPGGRLGELSAENLSSSLLEAGLNLARLKTGTPPRLNGRTIDYQKLEPQMGDEEPLPFSFSNAKISRPNVPCYVTYTKPETHEILRANLHRAPLYTGQIKSVGPRYCPSIEDKVVRFAQRGRHQVFLEPEGTNTLEVYCNGLATSVPQDVQEAMIHSIRGLENASIMRYGYAVEYDFVPPTQLYPWLETKRIKNLFLAGQINGTSGYEEAAAQGIMAGINAALSLAGKSPFVLDRSQAYIGVLVDDLVTKGTDEPYRMFTSRAEYRLILRQDNADRRLMRFGHDFGLIPDRQWQGLLKKEEAIRQTLAYLERKVCGGVALAQFLRRPGSSFADILGMDPELRQRHLPEDVTEQVEIEVKYAGYIEKQKAAIERFARMEAQLLPGWLDYATIPHLRREAAQKLSAVRPISFGQASRISGVSPADLSALLVYLKSKRVV